MAMKTNCRPCHGRGSSQGYQKLTIPGRRCLPIEAHIIWAICDLYAALVYSSWLRGEMVIPFWIVPDEQNFSLHKINLIFFPNGDYIPPASVFRTIMSAAELILTEDYITGHGRRVYKVSPQPAMWIKVSAKLYSHVFLYACSLTQWFSLMFLF